MNLDEKMDLYNKQKEVLLLYAKENNDERLIQIVNKLSLDEPNVLWDKIEAELPVEILAKEIKLES